MAKTTFTRIEFHELIWSESLASISREYFISYNCLREVCEEMAIPTPPNGYWSKLKFGKPVDKEPFWQSSTAKQEISLWLRTDEEGEEYFSKNTSELIKRKTDISKKINSTKKKSHVVDPLVIRTKEYYSKKNDTYSYDSRSFTAFSITVSKALIPRSLRLVEKFILLMNECGHSVIVENGKTYAVILEQQLQIYLTEKSNRVATRNGTWMSSDLVLNGKLCLKYYHLYPRREWVDNTILLEDKLLDIIAKLEVIAYNEKIEKESREKYWAEQKLLEQKRNELKAAKEKELLDFKSIFRQSKRYQQAVDLRNYICIFEENAIKNNSLTEEVQKKIEWARNKADWYDPFIETEDELLAEVDRETLTFKKESSW